MVNILLACSGADSIRCSVEGRSKAAGDVHHDDDGVNVAQVLLQQENDQLKRRLEQAGSRIQTLIRDKERLLEISNHLRAQLNRHEGGLIEKSVVGQRENRFR